jgi:succinyl-CoA synthetase beta subunit
MLLMEYIARDLLSAKGIAVPPGAVVESAADTTFDSMTFPAVVKAQVPVGGRGKAGGIKTVPDRGAAAAACREILGMTIKGHAVERVLIVEKVAARRELFLSILLDRGNKTPTIVFSTKGGMDIEEVARARPDRVVRVPVNPLTGVQEYTTRYLLDRGGLAANHFDSLHAVVRKLYEVFWDYDCLLAEINPLMIDTQDRFIAADAKISMDDSALPIRQPQILALRDALEREKRALEARKFGFLYIPIRTGGNVTIMSNGSGMLMASLDTLQQKGFRANSVLDLGGGATADRIAGGIGLMMDQPGVCGLFVNIFGGITRCDEIAGGIQSAAESLGPGQFIVVRMEGTNKARGREILEAVPRDRVVLVDRLSEAAGVMAERMARA